MPSRPARPRRQVARFRKGDPVAWNSEAGRVRGTIQRKVTRPTRFKGYVRHASPEEPQYVIQSAKTDHVAMHKGSALRRVTARRPRFRSKKVQRG